MQRQKIIMTVIAVIWPVLFIAGCGPVSRTEKTSRLTLPLLDYRKLDSYRDLKYIDPAGYFAVGLRYVHPPRVEWVPVDGAVRYDLVLLQDDAILGVTSAESSPAFATEGWQNGKTGKAGIVIIGYDTGGKRVALSRMFPFYIVSDLNKDNTVEKERPYIEAAWAVFDCLLSFDYPQHWNMPDDHPARNIHPVILTCNCRKNTLGSVSYPVLHNWIYVDLCESLLKVTDDPKRIKQIKDFMRSVGDHYLLCRLEGDNYLYQSMVRGVCNPMGGPRPDVFNSDPVLLEEQKRMIEPAKNGYAGVALLKIYETLGDKKYYDAALRMADIYHKTQQQDGSWPGRVDGKTGEVLGGYCSSVISVVAFMDRLLKHDPDPKWAQVKAKALAWVRQYPVKTYSWVVNYEDCAAQATQINPYVGLSNWDTFCFIRYAAGHPDEFENTAAMLREHLNWNDNHFVWYGDDPLLPFNPYYPVCGEQGNPASFISCYGCWVPMDFHTANWGTALLAAHKLTGDKDLLEKAKAAANAITKYQLDDGRTITWMQDRHVGVSSHYHGAANLDFWQTGWAAAANFWIQLHTMGYDD